MFGITSKMMLNRSAESHLPYFVPNLKINHSFFFPTIKFDVGYVLVFFFFFLNKCPSLDRGSSLLFLVTRIFFFFFTIDELLNFERCFSAFIEMVLLFFCIIISTWQIILIFLNVKPPLNS